MIDKELVKMNAYLPVKLSYLSKINPEAALRILQDWGDGTKPLRKLWEETTNLIDAATSKLEEKISS